MTSLTKKMTYVLITPARNEEAYIEQTIQSVIAQTVLPVKWIIVSDGSTDRTDEIVIKYLADYKWIELLRMPEHRDRQFAAKVNCFNAGYARVKNLQYDVIGNLDADISFDEDYLEFLIGKFGQIPELGVAGTPFIEDAYCSTTDSFEGEKHVAGGCQLFRRKCFEDIGGYIPIKDGIDWVAVTTARMKGWRTQSFREKYFNHHRKIGTGESNSVKAIFKYGTKDYTLGGHPLWVMIKVVYRMIKKPYIIGSIILLSGYLWALFRIDRPISQELVKFNKREQMQKLRLVLKSVLKFKTIDKFRLET
jgi:glycosyltransferase involved in cell wall biosynthesis